MLDLSEKDALRGFVEFQTPVRCAIELFCQLQAQRYRQDCTGYMSKVPRDPERAADAAARAEAYDTWLEELQHFEKNNR